MTGPRITVVTPSYNQAQFIEETIKSVIGQGYPNLEYIVIDGGSTDGSVDLIKKYEKHLSFWISEKDRGAADAIRKGFIRSTGTILAYLNSDDVYAPGCLQTAADELDESCDVLYGDTYWTDTEGHTIGQRRQTPFNQMGYLCGGFDLQQPSVFWKRDLYLSVGGINPEFRFAFDTDLFFRFVKAGARFKHIKQFFSSYRIHPESKSSAQSTICETELARLRTEHLKFSINSIRGKWFRNRARMQRAFSYLLQGDAMWLLSRIPDRLAARQSPVTVGPKARWM
jgi:glycosyltransferase involved in cell wall biosynthesis